VTEDSFDPALAARRLLRAARAATLATSVKGQPFASLVTPACLPDLSIVLLLSNLSEHTRHLVADPRCSLLVCGPAADAIPQTAPRLTVTGIAERIQDPAAKARFLVIHPYAALYADFADFGLWRIAPAAGLYVGGFARAHRLGRDALSPDPAAVAALAAAEIGIVSHCNEDHADAMALVAEAAGEKPGAWRLVTSDVDGCDLALDDRVIRVPGSAPARDAGDVRRELVRMTHAARGSA
jgi:putative heme iron utilization protein